LKWFGKQRCWWLGKILCRDGSGWRHTVRKVWLADVNNDVKCFEDALHRIGINVY